MDIDNTIILTDDDGNDVAFEFLALIEYENSEYVVLFPTEDDDSGEVVILKVVPAGDNEESYESIDNEAELMAVFELFKEKFKDEFTFED
ncbi:MAG: DUF1292 domain-containing protein [Oscillospiraceae bacterium]|nr:DUF1292 domain-containing protein [Oscillospiraceae bacterium]